MHEALFYKKLENNKVKCFLCNQNCILKQGELSVCGVRKNINGTLYSLNYDKIAAINSDPIEKKPLYHFLPSSIAFSIATMGCNFKCKFCQNYTLSQVINENQIYGEKIEPEKIVQMAIDSGAKSIAYTYSEPTIFYELMFETAKIAKQVGLKNLMITNGYIGKEAFDKLRPYLDAANIDLKSFSDQFYRKYCAARLNPVLENIKRFKQSGLWVEVTTLVIPDLNSKEQEAEKIIDFILSIDENIPWHVSRFFPHYKFFDVAITKEDTIYEFLNSGKKIGLKYLYAGNIRSNKWENTYCPECGNLLIERNGYYTEIKGLKENRCNNCNTEIKGIWE